MDILGNVTAKKHASGADFQEEIARTYFHGAPLKKGAKKKSKWKPKLPWLIAVIAILAAFSIVLSRSSIDVKVRVLGEIPSLVPGKMATGTDKGIFLIKGGEPNKDIIKSIYFSGDAERFSMFKPDELMLSNARGSGWASCTIELKEPADLNNVDIKYTAKGTAGDEYLLLAVGDSNNRIYRLEKDLSSDLSKDWQAYTVNLRRISKAIDLSNVARIKFEFGSLTAGNHSSAVLYLKDVYLAKTKRLKWL